MTKCLRFKQNVNMCLAPIQISGPTLHPLNKWKFVVTRSYNVTGHVATSQCANNPSLLQWLCGNDQVQTYEKVCTLETSEGKLQRKLLQVSQKTIKTPKSGQPHRDWPTTIWQEIPTFCQHSADCYCYPCRYDCHFITFRSRFIGGAGIQINNLLGTFDLRKRCVLAYVH